MLNDKDHPSLSPAFERNNVPVVIASNNLYAPYAGVFVQSLLDYASEENNYDIIIFERDISKENKRLLKGLVTGYTNVSVRFYDPSPLFSSFSFTHGDSNFWPVEVLYKIIAPHILNYSERVITVDVDMLLKADIARLMDENLEECCVGGVYDADVNGRCLCDRTPFIARVKLRDYYQDIYGLEDLKDYVNAGLLLFDRDKYVQELDVKTILNAAQQGEYLFPEQDTLNILMKGKKKLLDLAWNVLLPVNERKVEIINAASKLYGEIHNDSEAFHRAYENPCLLHWAGRPKPWVCPDIPYANEWWQTAFRTPFVGHIIARMLDAQETRRAYYRKRYGKEVDVWEPSPKGIDRIGK